jgi:hypothetical protein
MAETKVGRIFTPTPNDPDPFVSYKDLRDLGVPYCRLHLRRLIARNQFPAALQFSANRQYWKLSSIRQWQATRPTAVAYRRTGAGDDAA